MTIFYAGIAVLFVRLILEVPQFDHSLIRWQQLQIAQFGTVQELKWIDFLIQFYGLQMVKFGLVRLNFGKIAIVKVPWVSQIGISENNNASTFVSDCKEFTWFVEGYGRQNIHFWHIVRISLPKTVNVDPVKCLLSQHIASGSLLRLNRFFCSVGSRLTDRHGRDFARMLWHNWRLLLLHKHGLLSSHWLRLHLSHLCIGTVLLSRTCHIVGSKLCKIGRWLSLESHLLMTGKRRRWCASRLSPIIVVKRCTRTHLLSD